MHIIRRPAVQGHAVPATASHPRNPFDPAILAGPRIVIDEPEPEPYGATAQNGYRGQRLFACSYCSTVVPEDDVNSHTCEES